MSPLDENRCPGCQAVLRLPPGWTGEPLRCAACGTIVQGSALPLEAAQRAVPAAIPIPSPTWRRFVQPVLFIGAWLLGMVVLALAGIWTATQSPSPPEGLPPQQAQADTKPLDSKPVPEPQRPAPAPTTRSETPKRPPPVTGLVLSPEEQTLVDMTNEARQNEKLSVLKPNLVLFQVARAHSANMARQEIMEHELDGKRPHDRVLAAGYPAIRTGENIAYSSGRVPLNRIFQGWMNSPGHRKNILNGKFQEIGIGVAKAANGDLYYTQVFGTPR